MFPLTRRTYVDAETQQVVDEDFEGGKQLLGNEGDSVSDELAVACGLKKGGKAKPKDKDKERTEGLADKTIDELREVAAGADVELATKANKGQILAALEEAGVTG